MHKVIKVAWCYRRIDGGQIDVLPVDTVVEVLWTENGMARIRYNVDRLAWFNPSYLEPIEDTSTDGGTEQLNRHSAVHLAFHYNDMGELTSLSVFEAFEDGSTSIREFAPHA